MCPNSTESGCRCPEHHPGLGYTPLEPVTVTVLTLGPKPSTPTQDAGEQLVARARATCPACLGDPKVCQEGTGEPKFARLPGCAAWASNGHLAALKAPTQPRQPWEPRKAA